jgi:anti-sigma B factor antagonist
MKITTSVDELGVTLLEVQGEVDAHTSGDLDKALGELLAQNHSRLVLDFSQVGYVSSAGLQALLRAQQKARALGGEVRLFGLSPFVRHVFEMAGFDRLLHIAATRQEAMANW